METKYESGKLHGVFRCGKHEGFLKNIPQIDKPEAPDVTGIIISGILNYGNNPDLIRVMAGQCLGNSEISIPYEERNFARKRFIKDVILGKLCGTNPYSVDSLVRTFYEFVKMPTAKTKQLQLETDIQDINRYLQCEQRTPKAFVEPTINVCNTDFVCQHDILFVSTETLKLNRRKEGNKYVCDTVTMPVVESVKILPGKPRVKASSKIMDVGAMSRLELYIMLKASEAWCRQNGIEEAMLKASYYYLKKDREDSSNYSPDFFGKGGNVVSLQVRLSGMEEMDKAFLPQVETFLTGTSVDEKECETCSTRALCKYKDSPIPISDEEKLMPKALPVLSSAQLQAANALEGVIRVVATAGSGKTTTMAYRIMNLLKSGVPPEKIGCFTFTNASASEMSDRIHGFCKIAGIEADLEKMTISTIHSFGDSLLKKYYEALGYSKPPVLINEVQKTKIVEKILSDNPVIEALSDKYQNFYLDMFKAKGILELMKDCFTQITEGVSVSDFMRNNKIDHDTAVAAGRMYCEYLSYKKEACLIEHSDQERGVLRLLKVKPDLFEEVGLEHISVDEYQDTSNVQFEIIHAMLKARCTKSLFVVGDDDQSIYGFRNANVKLIQNFFKMVGQEGQDIQLMENRRSTGNIVQFADSVISYNEERIPKNPVSVKSTGEKVSVYKCGTKEEEQTLIVDKIVQLMKEGWTESDIAILAPTNSELLDYAKLLESRGIRSISINPEPVLENVRVSGAIALVKFLSNNNEFHGMNYINVRDGGKLGTEDELKFALEELQDKVSGVSTVTQLFGLFDDLDHEKTDEIYQAFLEDIKTSKDTAVAGENLSEVCEYVLDFERFGKKETARKEKVYDGVTLSTMHSAKGKEWPVVFCSVSKMHNRNLTTDDIPEKNRLLFVACTRAKELLYVTGAEVAFSSMNTGDVGNMFLHECLEIAGLIECQKVS